MTNLFRMGFVTVLLAAPGCLLEPSADAPASGTSASSPTAQAAIGPNLDQPVPPVHAGAEAWRFPEAVSTTGSGACAGVSLGEVLDRIRAGFEPVGDIESFRPGGPRGVVMSAGPGVPASETPPPPTETSSYVVGLMDENAFGAIFVRGERCRGDICEDHEYWYFETDERCSPAWVGHHRRTERSGGRYGSCLDVIGEALWRFPSPLDPRRRCDADWSPQDISGTRQALSLTGGPACGNAAVVPVTVAITQSGDLAQATVVLQGTGIPFLDGRAVTGKVERRRFFAEIQEVSADSCPLRRSVTFNFDFEGPSINAIPGGFGLVDVQEQTVAPCDPMPALCSASLHLVRAD